MSVDAQVQVPVSALNQYAYCPRRCALIHSEHVFADNIHTQRGTAAHERVDTLNHEIRAGIRTEFALPIYSDTLGLSGRCDVVEFHPDGCVYPIEYKQGKRQRWFNDDLQLAAQAYCLQEMLDVRIHSGAIFHIQSKRRREVEFTDALYQQVIDTVNTVRQLIVAPQLPPPTTQQQRCDQCSMHDICQPAFQREQQSQLQRLKHTLFIIND